MVGTIQGNSPLDPGSNVSGGSTNGSSSTSSLNNVQDSLVQQSLAIDSTIFDPAVPRLSLLAFQRQVGDAKLTFQKAETQSLLIDAETYKSLRVDGVISSSTLLATYNKLVRIYNTYSDLKNTFDNQLNAPLTIGTTTYYNGNAGRGIQLNFFINFSLTNFTQIPDSGPGNVYPQDADSIYYNIGDNVSRSLKVITPFDFTSNTQYQAAIAAAQSTITNYNSYANKRNTDIAAYNQAVSDYNSKIEAFNNDLEDLRQEIAAAEVNISLPPNLTALSTISSSWPTLPTLTAGTWSAGPPPGITGQLPPISSNSWNIIFTSIPSPTLQITPSIPSLIATGFVTTYIQPILDALAQAKNIQEKANDQIDYMAYFRLRFGQTIPGSIPQPPVNQQGPSTEVSGQGTSIASMTVANEKIGNPRLSEILTKSLLDQLYGTYGISAGSPLVGEVQKEIQKSLEYTAFSLVPISVKFLDGVTSPNSPRSDAISASVSFAFSQGIQGLVANNYLATALFKNLMQDLTFAGKSEDELKMIANGLASGLNVQLLSVAIFEVAKAIGGTGLLPQLLASLGGVSPQEIAKLGIGTVAFQRLNDNPLLKKELQDLLQEELIQGGVPKETARTLAQNALENSQNGLSAILQDLRKGLLANNLSLEGEAGITALLSDQNVLQKRLEEQRQEAITKNEVGIALYNAGVEAGAIQKLLGSEKLAGNESQILAILNKGGVENPEEALQKIIASVNNPLRSTQVAAPLTIDQFSQALTSLLENPFSTNAYDKGVIGDKLQEIVQNFTQGPASIAQLLKDNLEDIKTKSGQESFDKAVQSFSDFIEPKVSLVAFTRELLDPGKMLVFLDKVQYQGIVGKTAGPGAPSGFGYMQNSTLSV